MGMRAAALLAALLAWSAGALAQEAGDAPAALSGTLAKARSSGAVTIAYRESSIPFSYLNDRHEPIGYSIELCRRLVEAISGTVGRDLEIK